MLENIAKAFIFIMIFFKTYFKDIFTIKDGAPSCNSFYFHFQVVSKKTPDEQLKTLVFSLTDGLTDAHAQSSSGACAILNCLMKFRGGELNKEVRSFKVNRLLYLIFPN